MRRYILTAALCLSLAFGLAHHSPLTHPLWRLSFVPEAFAEDGSYGSAITVTPTSLAFSYQQGGSLPASQRLSVTSSGSTSFTAAKSSATWFSITPTSGTTPAYVTVSAKPGTMAAGTYNASVTVSSRAGSVTVPVTLKISSATTTTTLIVSPSSLAFGFQQGGSTPASQSLSVSSSSTAISFNDSKSSASWLSISRTSGTTPSSIGVSVNPGSLAVGTYTASVSVNSNYGSVTVPVTLTVTSSTSSGGGTSSGGYVLLAWSELGMHCMDGKDYSIASVLPPYNTIYAKLLTKGGTPTAVTPTSMPGVTITYQAMYDTSTTSINTYSAGTGSQTPKTNFWSYVTALFPTVPTPQPDVGLHGYPVQSLTPQQMGYGAMTGFNPTLAQDSSRYVWKAEGVPTAPLDDNLASKPYPMVKLIAKNSSGQQIASATVVLAVSDEMSCKNCHASPGMTYGGSNPNAMPTVEGGPAYSSDPLKDTKLNILKMHDQKWSSYITSNSVLAGMPAGYGKYQASLYNTAMSGTPVLCAACHLSIALKVAGVNTGVNGVKPLTQAMHTLHSTQTLPNSQATLDNMADPNNTIGVGCYQCHPGTTTKCQRGAMTGTMPNSTAATCYSCHGNLTAVGNSSRTGWLSEPSCQMCHQNGATSSTVQPVGSDQTFATSANVPDTGFSLYRFSQGHGSTECAACHGSQHAEYPTNQANDNVYSINIQGYAGRITECAACHSTTLSVTSNGGPHGMHTVGQAWVSAHPNYASGGGYTACAYCHGSDYRGTSLSRVLTSKTFNAGDYGTKSFSAYHQVSCYDCHNGPNGG